MPKERKCARGERERKKRAVGGEKQSVDGEMEEGGVRRGGGGVEPGKWLEGVVKVRCAEAVVRNAPRIPAQIHIWSELVNFQPNEPRKRFPRVLPFVCLFG